MFSFLFGWIWRDKDRIKELETLVSTQEVQISARDELIKERDKKIEDLRKSLASINEDILATPSDCKPGVWCRGCAFAKSYIIGRIGPFGYGHGDAVVTCTKNGSCQHYLPRNGEDSTDVT